MGVEGRGDMGDIGGIEYPAAQSAGSDQGGLRVRGQVEQPTINHWKYRLPKCQ